MELFLENIEHFLRYTVEICTFIMELKPGMSRVIEKLLRSSPMLFFFQCANKWDKDIASYRGKIET